MLRLLARCSLSGAVLDTGIRWGSIPPLGDQPVLVFWSDLQSHSFARDVFGGREARPRNGALSKSLALDGAAAGAEDEPGG